MSARNYTATYDGAIVPFAPVLPEDDVLHSVEGGAPFTRIETYLLGFNIPEQLINCNIYLLWHPALGCMSAHVIVTCGAVIYRHQLEAPYFNEHQYLPSVPGPATFSFRLGSCQAEIRVIEPLQKLAIRFADRDRDFLLDFTSAAALPPVGRPGGKHFTQLMQNHGALRLGGQDFAIDGYYMRDRSWGYERPEGAEAAPPYRWITGWNDVGDGMVIAWLDTAMLGAEYADWCGEVPQARAANKWEHGGATPGVTLRSGWISRGGQIRAVTSATISCEPDPLDRRMTRTIGLKVLDDSGDVHIIRGQVRQSYPKMYWQTMLTWMHMVELDWDGVRGGGDLMDTFSHWHFRQPNMPVHPSG